MKDPGHVCSQDLVNKISMPRSMVFVTIINMSHARCLCRMPVLGLLKISRYDSASYLSCRPFVPWEGCSACWANEDHRNILLCDGCNSEYHYYCVRPPLPDIPPGAQRQPSLRHPLFCQSFGNFIST